MQKQNLKKECIEIGRLLWDKDLATGLNGNISIRVDDKEFLLTAHGTCLGRLSDSDLLLVDLQGNVLEAGEISTENLLHREIYLNYPEAKAVVHTHTPYINGYFLVQKIFSPEIFEAKVYLGDITAVDQLTPAVTDAGPVIKAFKKGNIVVLRNHGVVAMGETLFDCFVLIQSLEEAIKTESIRRLYRDVAASEPQREDPTAQQSSKKRFKLFSQEQINGIVDLVNRDSQFGELGEKTKMVMNLAVKLEETGQVHSFQFENGRIKSVGHDENAEFLITAPEKVWRSVFNREIDPFVATTQKKMNLQGDFAKISKWYAPCSRIFELWTQVPIE